MFDDRTKTVTMNERQRRLLRIFSLILNVSVGIVHFNLINHRRSRRWWIRPINRNRNIDGQYGNLFLYMKQHDHEEFFEYTRMYPDKFNELVELLRPLLVKNSIRKPLPVELRVAVTLS